MVTETTETTTDRLTHCPTCGMKITRDDLSLCSYCGSPLQLGQEKQRLSETTKRLGKMVEHKNYEAAMAWSPPEGSEFLHGVRMRRRGKYLFGLGGLLAAVTVIVAATGGSFIFPAVLAVLSATSFPVGTAYCAYAIYVCWINDESKASFR